MEKVIVSSYKATREFLAKLPEYKGAPALSFARPEDIEGKIVVGNLPLWLAAKCKRYFAVEFTRFAPRGIDLSDDQLIQAGLRITEYNIQRVEKGGDKKM